MKFRTKATELKEDLHRARCLNNTFGLTAAEIAKTHDLRSRLLSANDTGIPAPTLASAVYHREVRMPILEAVWRLVEDAASHPCAFVTLRPQGMLCPAAQLDNISPALLMKRVRNDLDRSGVTSASGFGFFGLDGECDANRHGGVYDFHVHGIVAGDKVRAIEDLRHRPKYDNARIDPLECGLPVGPRLQV